MTGAGIRATRTVWLLLALVALVLVTAGPADAQDDPEPTTALEATTASSTEVPPTTAPEVTERPPVERVLVFSLPAVRWGDLDEVQLPHLEPFLDLAAIGDLSVRGVGERTSPTDGYATIGAGTRARGGATGQLAFVGDEQQGGQSARDEFARRTGVIPGPDDVFALSIVGVTQANDRLDYGAEVGALGDALAAGGYTTAVVANADRWQGDALERHAPSALAMVDSDGLVPAGTVGLELLDEHIDAPGSLVLDRPAVVAEFAEVWQPRSVVTVEASDMARWDAVAARLPVAERELARLDALAASDVLFGELLEHVDPTTDAVLVVGPYDQRVREHVTIAALQAPGIAPGLLRSSTTRRSGFVTLADVGPTVLDLTGIDRPTSMEGRPFEVGTEGGDAAERRAFLVESDQDATFRDAHVAPASTGYVIGHVVLWLLAAAALRWGRRRQKSMVEVMALCGITFLPATHLATSLPFEDWGDGSWWAFVGAVSLSLALIAWYVGRHTVIDGLIIALAMVVGLLIIDVVVGAPLQLNAVFGYSPTVAGRFAGYGNLAFAELAAASIMLAALLAQRIGGRRGLWAATAVLAVAVVVDGAPFWGSDVGGVLTLVPAGGVTVWLLAGRSIRWQTILMWGAGAVIAVGVFGLIDLTRPEESRTHLARLVEAVGDGGLGPLRDVVTRKLDANLTVLTSSVWTLMVPLILAALGYLFWKAPGILRRVGEEVPAERAALAGMLVAMFLGFAVNDSGIAVPGVMLGVLNASLVYLVLRTAQEGDHVLIRSRSPVEPRSTTPDNVLVPN
jgi:hypothetical protein